MSVIEASKYHSVSLSAEPGFSCPLLGGKKIFLFFLLQRIAYFLKFYHYNAYNIPSKSKKQQKK